MLTVRTGPDGPRGEEEVVHAVDPEVDMVACALNDEPGVNDEEVPWGAPRPGTSEEITCGACQDALRN